jgi:peptide deformylase
MTNPLVEAAADAFSTALVQWRAQRRLTKKQLAAEMGFDPSYVSHVEARRHRPTEDFARRAEAVLHAGGDIWQRFRDYDQARHAAAHTAERPVHHRPTVPEQWHPTTDGLIVEQEHSHLTYSGGAYRCVIRRDLFNGGDEPVTRYPIRIAIDRYPGEPERSNRHHRDHPLTWGELTFTARCGDEPMSWERRHDRDAFKEVWLLFENDDGHFPLYPGRRTTIEYAYTVGADKYGPWFQRAVRMPTRQLSLHLDLPTAMRPVVWGVAGSLTAENRPMRTPILERVDGDRTHFDWSTEDPPLHARYRLEWRFRGAEEPAAEAAEPAVEEPRPSDLMRRLGIVQRGAPVLQRHSRWLDLPEQAALAEDVVANLRAALDRLDAVYQFNNGVGLTAPQLGIDWAIAVVRGADRAVDPVVLLNPRVVAESDERDARHEGCLSFLDVRGEVSRPLRIDVEHSGLDGSRTVSTFTGGLARMVAHEVDHLDGRLYSDRMAAGARLIPVEQFEGHGIIWEYDGQ